MSRNTTRRWLGVTSVASALLISGSVLTAGFDSGSIQTAANRGHCPSFWVAPDGDDRARGTERSPWASIERARDEIRKREMNSERHMRCDITVNLEAGEYRVDETIEFDDRDSGANGHNVVYRSADGPGEATLVGAEELTGWEPAGDGSYKTSVEDGQRFYTLFEDGERSEVARYPNRANNDTHGPYLFSRLGEPEKEAVRMWLYWEEGDWDPAWEPTEDSNPLANAQATIWSGGSWSWFSDIVPLESVDYRTGSQHWSTGLGTR